MVVENCGDLLGSIEYPLAVRSLVPLALVVSGLGNLGRGQLSAGSHLLRSLLRHVHLWLLGHASGTAIPIEH